MIQMATLDFERLYESNSPHWILTTETSVHKRKTPRVSDLVASAGEAALAPLCASKDSYN